MAIDLKARLDKFVTDQQRALVKLEASYLIEKTRLEAQIASSQLAVSKWDARADALIAALESAGIRLEVE